MVVEIKAFNYEAGFLQHKTDAVFPDWTAALQMANTVWENNAEAVSITETKFASGIMQVSVASKQRIVYQITEVNDAKKQPAQTSIFGD